MRKGEKGTEKEKCFYFFEQVKLFQFTAKIITRHKFERIKRRIQRGAKFLRLRQEKCFFFGIYSFLNKFERKF